MNDGDGSPFKVIKIKKEYSASLNHIASGEKK